MEAERLLLENKNKTTTKNFYIKIKLYEELKKKKKGDVHHKYEYKEPVSHMGVCTEYAVLTAFP